MKRSWTPVERAWSIGLILALALGVAGAPAQAADCQLEIKFAPSDSTTTPDFTQVLGSWVRSSIVVNAQPSKPNNGIYQWTQVSGPAGVLSNANTPQPTFAVPDVGVGGAQAVLRLSLTGCSSTVTKDFTVNITDAHSIVANNPPTAYAAATPASATEGTMVSLDSAGSYDPDNNALSYAWVQTGGPPVVLTNASSAVATFIAPNLSNTQTLRFQLTVSDGSLSRSAEAMFNAVWTNDPPVARISCPVPFTVDEGQSVTLNGGASTDSDDGIASYLWEQTVGLPVAPVPTGVLWNTPTVTFNAPTLGYSQTGLMPFRFTVTDASGASASQVCSIIVRDITAPTITGVHNILAEATSPAGALVGFGISAFDVVDGDLTGLLACTPPAGTFALGTTGVSCSVQDSATNPASANFNVTVADSTPPTIIAPLSVAVEATGPDGAVVTFAATTADAVDGAGNADCVAPSGSLFPVDDSNVTCTATDSHHNTATPATIAIHVLDTQAPVISGVSGDLVEEATSASGAVVSFDLPIATDVVDLSVPVSCSSNSGDVFAIGETTVTCSTVDAHLNTANASFKVTVRDTLPPEMSTMVDIEKEATSPSGAVVTFAAPAATDAVDGAVTAVCTPASGSTFALDATTVDCAASDARGNTAHRTFVVTVVDTTPPTLTNVSPDLVVEAESSAGAPVTFQLPTASDLVDGDVTTSCDPAPGHVFGFAPTTVNCSATDAHGNTASASFTVTVLDRTPPTIHYLSDNLTVEATAPAGAVVTYGLPTASDLVDGDVAVSCAPPSGSTFALGQVNVTCTATDAHGNTAQGAFGVWVVDTTAPTVTPPANASAEATGPLTAVVHGSATAADAVGVASLVNNAPASFPLGTTTITWTATDAAGNAASATSTVTVVDTTGPALTVPADLTREATSGNGAVVSFSATADDLVDGNVGVNCAPASGSSFALGATTVTCSASDLSHNTASRGFTITVVDTTKPVIAPHADVVATASANSGANVSYELPTATDLVDGSVGVSCSAGSGSWFIVGTNTVTCSATDAHGNTATSTFKVIVGYGFNGFFRPIDNGVINIAKAGSAIPVKFSLGGNQGLAIFAAGSPASIATNCSATQSDAIEETVTAGGSSLQYDPVTDQYIYVWKTEKSWSGCRELQLKLKDGKTYRASFSFTR